MPPVGFEPTTPGLRNRCYYQLSYRGECVQRVLRSADPRNRTRSSRSSDGRADHLRQDGLRTAIAEQGVEPRGPGA